MILQKEIRALAETLKVPLDTIDKDYVLGHFLAEMFKQQWARENFLFKGGTCLKKCYFEAYRFSEDIDATITNPNFELTKKQIRDICNTITRDVGIHFNIIQFDKISFKDLQVGWDIKICFWGANHGKNDVPKFNKDCHTKIECDFRFYETIFFQKEERELIHLFSDKAAVAIKIPCYSISEVLAEKMRSLIQRNYGTPRDYYDLWYIKTHVQQINWVLIRDAFYAKCKYKQITFNGVDDFFKPERIKQVENDWVKRLNHQLPQKANMDDVINDLKLFFTQLFK